MLTIFMIPAHNLHIMYSYNVVLKYTRDDCFNRVVDCISIFRRPQQSGAQGKCPSCLPSVGGYASNTPFIMIIPGNFPTGPGYSENLPDYSRIFPDSFNHLLCSKLCRHKRRMPISE